MVKPSLLRLQRKESQQRWWSPGLGDDPSPFSPSGFLFGLPVFLGGNHMGQLALLAWRFPWKCY